MSAQPIPIPPNPDFKEGYWLVPRPPSRRTVPCPAGGHFLVEYDVRRKCSAGSAQKLGREWTKLPDLIPEESDRDPGRWDLRVNLKKEDATKHHGYYHRIVGLLLTKTWQDTLGRKLQQPRLVDASSSAKPKPWGTYMVAHRWLPPWLGTYAAPALVRISY